jgi:hypothetical protein
MMPNQSLEPTGIGAFNSASRVVAVRRWLSSQLVELIPRFSGAVPRSWVTG